MAAYSVVAFGTVGPNLANSLAYIAGPGGAWMMKSTWMIVGSAVLFLLAVFAVNVRGLHLGKWITGSGSVMVLLSAAVVLYLLITRWATATPFAHAPFSLALPSFSILTLAVFTKISIGALSGFDCAAAFGGECRSPVRDLRLSVLLASPLIAAIYILGTGTMLAYVPPGEIDLAAPVQQLIHTGFGNAGLGGLLTTTFVLGLTVNTFAGAVALIGMTARFGMVAGLDGLLPDWWTELHAGFRTPVKALGMVTLASITVALLTSWRAGGGQEITQIGLNAGVACMCISYALLFSVVLIGKRSLPFRAGPLVRLAALSGALVSLAALPFQVVPVAGAHTGIFALKVSGIVSAINAVGAGLYWLGVRRLSRRSGRATNSSSKGDLQVQPASQASSAAVAHSDSNTAVADRPRWGHVTLNGRFTYDLMLTLLNEEISGIRIPKLFSSQDLSAVMTEIQQLKNERGIRPSNWARLYEYLPIGSSPTREATRS